MTSQFSACLNPWIYPDLSKMDLSIFTTLDRGGNKYDGGGGDDDDNDSDNDNSGGDSFHVNQST